VPIPLRRVRHHARVAPATPDHPFKEEIIALKRAQLPLPLAAPLRLGILAVGLTIWIALTMRYAVRHPLPRSEQGVAAGDSLTRRDILILILILAPLATYVVGVLRYDWGLNELSDSSSSRRSSSVWSAGSARVEARRRISREWRAWSAPPFSSGVARGISVVLTDGRVIDTIVQGLASPLIGKPPALAAVLMVPIGFAARGVLLVAVVGMIGILAV